MAICGGCGAETTRTRSIYNDKHLLTKEECNRCNPSSFDPQWKTAKGATAWEAYPDKYKKITNPDGSITYRSTDEWRAESEAKILRSYEQAEQPSAAQIEEKRRNRRTDPLSATEIEQINNRVRQRVEAARQQAAQMSAESQIILP